MKFIPYSKGKNFELVSKEMRQYESKSPMPYNWFKGVTCGSYAHNLATGDDITDIEMGAPGSLFFNTTPWSGTKITYDF